MSGKMTPDELEAWAANYPDESNLNEDAPAIARQAATAERENAALRARVALLENALAGEAVKVSDYDGEWRCGLCGWGGEEGEPVAHLPGCLLARAALAEPSAPAPDARDRWQPIEGHQFKDHEHVLVAHGPTGHVCEAWWCDDEQMFYMANTHPTDAHDGSLPYASEWCPLPEPPRALSSTEPSQPQEEG